VKLTPGKLAGMKAVSDTRGVIAAAAMDQRGSLKKSLAKEKGVPEVPDKMLEDFKSIVTEVLTKHASAILLDPEFGLPAAKKRNQKGLLLAYEQTGYDNNRPGRIPDLLNFWSVRRLKAAGADCIKVLIYYSPFDSKEINEEKHAFVERIGDECRGEDIPFFLEFVGYDPKGGDEKGLEYAKQKPESVIRSMGEFTKQSRATPEKDRLTRAKRRSTFSANRQRYRPSRSFISLPASATASSPRRWNWRQNRA
jgi:tagatose 1,6-diphosphate aldolase